MSKVDKNLRKPSLKPFEGNAQAVRDRKKDRHPHDNSGIDKNPLGMHPNDSKTTSAVLCYRSQPIRNGQYMKGVIRADTSKIRCTFCGGQFKQVRDEQFTHPIPRCMGCGKPPKFLKIRVTLPALGKRDIRHNLKGTRLSTLPLADAFLQDVHDEIRTGTFDPNKYLSPKQRKQYLVRFFLGQFLSEKKLYRGSKKGCSPSYVDDAESLIRIYLDPYFGDMEITVIRYHHLKDFMNQGTGTERQRSKALAILRTVIKEASKSLPELAIPKFPTLPEARLKNSFIDADTQQLVLRNVKNHYLAVKILTVYPIRPCEIRALKWMDIDFKKGNMTIRRHFSSEVLLDGRKSATDPNDRYYTLPLTLTDEILADLKRMPRSLDNNDFVFKTRGGRPLGEKTLYKEWTAACARAGVKLCPLYDGTKHSTMTHMNQEEGVPLDKLSVLAGQTNSHTTRRYVAAESLRLSDLLIKKRRGGKGVDVSDGSK